MDSNFRNYDHVSSFSRIDGILALSQGNFEEVRTLPDRDKLTYTNGFYADCAALFVDIRDSSQLPHVYNRPALAKLYRAYISELTAIMNGNPQAREVNIMGDCVWAVFNTPQMSHIDEVFATAAKIHSLVNVLNCKLLRARYETPIRVGIGMDYGRALMVKAGYNGSGIADVVYMGDVVNQAAKLASRGGRAGEPPMMIGDSFAVNLTEEAATLIAKDWRRGCYTSSAVNVAMNDWHNEHCTQPTH